jgi:chromosome segregation ATPase
MPFTFKDFQGLLRLLERQPAWKDALRAALLGEEFAELPRLVRELVRAQRATNRQIHALVKAQAAIGERLNGVEQALGRLAAAQARTEEEIRALVREVATIKQDVAGLKQDVAGVKQDVAGLKQDMAGLKQDMAGVKQDMAGLKQDVAGLKQDVAGLKGTDLERTYRERAAQYFQAILRRIRVVDHQHLADLLDDAVDAGRITPEEKDQVLQSDVAAMGRRDGERAYLLAEVSSVVDRENVERARNRASVLERATGMPVVAAAAGRQATAGARGEARASGVWLVLDGRAEPPD